ncbi:hypothetical protein HN011_010327, partial [Eciton burchellii]
PLGTPTAHKTAIGWIISDLTSIAPYNADKPQMSLCISECDTNTLLRIFWENEEIPQKLKKRINNVRDTSSLRTAEGRNTVRLHFKTSLSIDISNLLPTHCIHRATALHARMESRLQSRPEISKQYYDFFHEYFELDHMASVTEDATTLFKPVYIPHQAVIRKSSSTTKLRVVFNAS